MLNLTRVAVVDDQSAVGQARRLAVALAQEAGLPQPVIDRIALVATEMATNLARHAHGQREILIRATLEEDPPGLELISTDPGPGISDPTRALTDGYSSAGGPGLGLGSIRRQADVFEMMSDPTPGTYLLARFGAKAGGNRVGALLLPKPGEDSCGDQWAVRFFADRALVVLADGLGHGDSAAAASTAATRALRLAPAGIGPAQLLTEMDDALRGSRGAAVAVAEIQLSEKRVLYAASGNISGMILSSDGHRTLAGSPGVVGHRMGTVHEQEVEWPNQGRLVLASDGLKSGWSLERYPALSHCHPAILAAYLYREQYRGSDDAGIVAVAADL